jgi:hypothetical protein
MLSKGAAAGARAPRQRSCTQQPACVHRPPCPPPHAADHNAAHVVAAYPEQGWSLLCNGVVLFEDTGELLPGGVVVAPHRPAARVRTPRRAPHLSTITAG